MNRVASLIKKGKGGKGKGGGEQKAGVFRDKAIDDTMLYFYRLILFVKKFRI